LDFKVEVYIQGYAIGWHKGLNLLAEFRFGLKNHRLFLVRIKINKLLNVFFFSYSRTQKIQTGFL